MCDRDTWPAEHVVIGKAVCVQMQDFNMYIQGMCVHMREIVIYIPAVCTCVRKMLFE